MTSALNVKPTQQAEQPNHTSSFNIARFREKYPEYTQGKLSYADLERYAGGLPTHRTFIRTLWDALEMAVIYTLIRRASGR